jgi:uncharacterized membrane protein
MNSAHLHLLLNHFPIIGTLIGFVLLIIAFIRKSSQLKMASAYIIAAMTILSLPLPSTGEAAEEVVENLPGISETVIKAHEEAADLAMWIMAAAGLAALISIVMGHLKKPAVNSVMIITLILSALAFGAMARTGYLGGKIRHNETTGITTVKPAEAGNIDEDD